MIDPHSQLVLCRVNRYVSGAAIYDAAFEFEVNLADRRHLNPSVGGETKFGVGQALVQEQRRLPGFPNYKWRNAATGQTHLVTEFKVAADELLRDIQRKRSEKQIKDINLLVCVRCDEREIRRIQGAALLPVGDPGRKFSGVVYELAYAGHIIGVICLGDVISELERLGEIRRL